MAPEPPNLPRLPGNGQSIPYDPIVHSREDGTSRALWPKRRDARLLAGTGLAGAFVLAALGQASVLERRFTSGAALYGIAALLFAVLLRIVEGPRPSVPVVAAPVEGGLRRGFLGLLPPAFALLGFAVRGVLVPRPGLLDQRLLAPAWILALGLFLVSVLGAVRWRPGTLRGLRESVRTHGLEITVVGSLVFLALALRTIDLARHPYPFVNDEGRMGLEAVSVLAGRNPSLFGTGWAGIPLVGFLPYGASILAFGRGILALRAVSALEGTLGVLFVYLLGRLIAGRAVGLASAGFAATLPLHLHFSRLGVSNVVDGFTGPLVLGLTLRAIRKGRVADYLWAGLATGAALYVYLGSRLVIVLVAGVLGWQVLRERRFLRSHGAQLLAFAAAFLFVTAPMAVFFARAPGEFMGRIHSESILFNGWLHDTAARTGRPAPDLVLEQFSSTLGGFLVNPARFGFFNSPRPYLFPAAAVFCILGMAYAVSRIRQTGYLALVVWFWAVLILGSTLMVNPPSSERLVQSVAPMSVFFGLGVWKLAEVLSRLGVARRLAATCGAGIVAVTGLQGAGYYFGEYRSLGCFGNEVDEAIQEIAAEARRLGPGYRVFLIGMPSEFEKIPNFEFLLPDFPKADIARSTPEVVARLPRDLGAFFSALPDREETLRDVAALLPGGEWKTVRREYRDEVCTFRYVVSPERMAALGPVPVPASGSAEEQETAARPAPASRGASSAAGSSPNGGEVVEIDGATVEVEHSDLDLGRIQDLFDGSRNTLARTASSTVFVVDLGFAAPKKVSAIVVTTGSMTVLLKATLTVKGKSEPAVYQKTFTRLPPDPTVTLDFGGAHEVEKARIEIGNADGGDGHVHVRELKLE